MPSDQIFSIRGSKGRFATCYEIKGYLPPLELPEAQSEIPIIPLSNKDVLVKMAKVLAESRYWNKKTVELFKSHLDKKKGKYD